MTWRSPSPCRNGSISISPGGCSAARPCRSSASCNASGCSSTSSTTSAAPCVSTRSCGRCSCASSIWRDPELHDDLHRRAAAIWADRGDVAEAHRLSVSIGDLAHAFTLVIAPTFDLINRGDAAGAARLMVSFPRDTDVDEPALALDMAVASFFARNHDEASRWSDRAAQLLTSRRPHGAGPTPRAAGPALAHARRRGVSGGARGRVRPRGTARRCPPTTPS